MLLQKLAIVAAANYCSDSVRNRHCRLAATVVPCITLGLTEHAGLDNDGRSLCNVCMRAALVQNLYRISSTLPVGVRTPCVKNGTLFIFNNSVKNYNRF